MPVEPDEGPIQGQEKNISKGGRSRNNLTFGGGQVWAAGVRFPNRMEGSSKMGPGLDLVFISGNGAGRTVSGTDV